MISKNLIYILLVIAQTLPSAVYAKTVRVTVNNPLHIYKDNLEAISETEFYIWSPRYTIQGTQHHFSGEETLLADEEMSLRENSMKRVCDLLSAKKNRKFIAVSSQVETYDGVKYAKFNSAGHLIDNGYKSRGVKVIKLVQCNLITETDD